MSAEAMGYVFRYSTCHGATLLVHLAIADSVNDMHGMQFWMSVTQLSMKARTSRPTTIKALKELVDRGFLTELNKEERKGATYRFEMPKAEPVFRYSGEVKPRDIEERLVKSVDQGVKKTDTSWSSDVTHLVKPVVTNPIEPKESTQAEPKLLALAPQSAQFAVFYSIYPRKKAPGDAEKAWKQATRSYDPELIVEAARAYRDDPNRPADLTLVPYPASWLRAKRFLDGPEDAPQQERRQWAEGPLDHRSRQFMEGVRDGTISAFEDATQPRETVEGRRETTGGHAVRSLPNGPGSDPDG